MRYAPQRLLILTGAILAAAPVFAVSEFSEIKLRDNHRLLAEWRADPEHHARLLHNLQTFQALSDEERERLRQMDRDWQQLDNEAQRRLVNVRRRYLEWLDQLGAADRKKIESASDSQERLAAVRAIKLRQWLDQLPKSDRDRLRAADKDQRVALIQQMRADEWQRLADWKVAQRHWGDVQNERPLPARLSDFPPEVKKFVDESLRPLLTEEETRQLRTAEGQWPQFPRTLVELADRHPLTIPGPIGPLRVRDLPPDVIKNLRLAKGRDRLLRQAEGRWPEFGIAVVEYSPRSSPSPLPSHTTPSLAKEFSPAVNRFITQDLLPRLDATERSRLTTAEGHWPQYPQMIVQLAQKYALEVPEMRLPGPWEQWAKYRFRYLGTAETTLELQASLRDVKRW